MLSKRIWILKLSISGMLHFLEEGGKEEGWSRRSEFSHLNSQLLLPI